MRLIVLSDIHSNSWALKHIVKKYRGAKFCILGDAIGYGPDPVGCLKIIKELDDCGEIYSDASGRRALIGGNHEESWLWCEAHESDFVDQISHLPPAKRFAPVVRQVNERILGDFNRAHGYNIVAPALIAMLLNMAAMRVDPDPAVEWYRSLVRENGYGPMEFPANDFGGWTPILAHGTYDWPLNGYLYPCNETDPSEAERYVKQQKRDSPVVLLHGHTHVPMYLSSGPELQPDFAYNVECHEDHADIIVINPGSIGLPRDHDPRPSAVSLEFDGDSLKPTFLREDKEWKDGTRKLCIEQLKELHYPLEIVNYFIKARASSKFHHEKCRATLKKLRRRAGAHWTGD